ncbi:SRPBCC family protein [Flaviramulus sp. BrNp1-15]|uniref:SRPBCC family protein n=1 Tax=Flaviramulus sp. BrNp1-15 TaxID=2916754 RepID=UPI001EE9A5A5|nr:SRPBCC family protein [Flaviramulus sp. BrNp1-15]ULC58580.1 SRPBCC family protein [Flaviramulus sp. BrNp1-15]
MPIIELHTTIDSDIKTCFDLARDVDFYQKNLKHSKEIALAGRTTGLVELNDYVTWEANYMGFVQHLTLKITEFEAPNLFVDELAFGAYKSYRHEHLFRESDDKTIMTDRFYFELPYGILGKFVNWIFLKSYMTKLLKTRNSFLKEKAESL